MESQATSELQVTDQEMKRSIIDNSKQPEWRSVR